MNPGDDRKNFHPEPGFSTETSRIELSQKYKSPSQNWNILFAIRGKVIVRIRQPIARSHEGRMDHIAKKRIMIVGKDAHFSYLLQRFVRTSTYRTIPVNLGDDVLSFARDEKPVAIVLEVDTPQIVGWDALRALKSDPDVASIPVIVCSWLDESARGLAEGADMYLRMPILFEEFGAALTTLLGEDENGKHH